MAAAGATCCGSTPSIWPSTSASPCWARTGRQCRAGAPRAHDEPARSEPYDLDEVATYTQHAAESRTVTLSIDGREVIAPEGTTIWEAAKSAGIEIPVLCHDERYDPVGMCRMCVVDVGGRVYAASCVRPVEEGMEVKTATPEVERNRATLTQLLMADQPPTGDDPKEITTGDNELLALARRYGVRRENGLPVG